MDRRKSLKSLLAGTVTGGILLNGCSPQESDKEQPEPQSSTEGYGRLPHEMERDERLHSEQFFNDHEMETIAALCDLILPPTANIGGALDAGVPEFIEFIAKDLVSNQLPLRGGIMWLDHRANKMFENDFIQCSNEQQHTLLDEIAYPKKAKPEVEQGVRFFTLMRNLTLTGYYTTKIGIEDLGYKGNTPNVWDGVPEDVLSDLGMRYDEDWVAKCIDQDTRNDIADWDEEGNLLN